MTEPHVIRCLLCLQSFKRDSQGTDQYLQHRENCARNAHPSNPERTA